MIRRIDELGRVTIPLHLRVLLGIEEQGNVTIKAQGNKIIIEREEK